MPDAAGGISPAYDVAVTDHIPTGTLALESNGGPGVAEFTAPSSGTYTLSATFTDPNFDPFDGPNGGLVDNI